VLKDNRFFKRIDSHRQTIIERLNKQMNHQISEANPKTCEGIAPPKLAFLTQMTYKIKPS
jgi:hypothetical protein